MRTLALTAVLLLSILGARVALAQADRYAEGQVWEYRTRPGDEGSILKIQKIETDGAFEKLGPVYHISVIGFKLSNPAVVPVLQEAPVTRATLDASVTRLSTRTDAFPDPTEGITGWRKAKGGVYTIPVAQIIEGTELSTRGLGR